MALKYLIPVDLNQNEIRNAILHLLGTDPGSPIEGQIWYNTAGHTAKLRLASSTIDLLNPALLNSQPGSFYLARANHTGTQLANTVSDFDTQVRTSRLDQMAAPNIDLSIGSHKLTNVTDPTIGTDAATKNYVDGIAAGGVYWKNPVRVAAPINITISSPGAAIDGVTLANGDRVALVSQSTGSQNGIYVFNGAAAALTRSSDADTSGEVPSGIAFWVSEGTVNADTAWTLTTNDPIVLGTTSLTFVQFSGLGQVTAGAGLTKTGNSLDVGAGTGITVNADNVQISATYAGQTSIVTVGTITTGTWQGTAVGVGFGGTGATTASGARTNLGACGKYSALIGNGSSTTFTVTAATHGLGATNQLQTQAYEATGAWVLCDISVAASGDVTFTFAVAPASNAIRIVIIG
jgi:hypothetical protein